MIKFLIWWKYHFGKPQDRIAAHAAKSGAHLDIRPGREEGEIAFIAFVNPKYWSEYENRRPSFVLNRAQRRRIKVVK